MQAIVEKPILETALRIAKEALEKKSVLPVLNKFYIYTAGEKLIIKASDLENYLTLSVPANVLSEGGILVDGFKLEKIVRELPFSEVIIRLANTNAIFESGKTKLKLPSDDIEEFPEFPEPKGEKEFSIEASLFLKAINKVDFAIEKEPDIIELAGMHVKGKGKEIDFVGTNGHRLVLYRIRKEELNEFNEEFTIPKKSLMVLRMLLALSSIGEVKFTLDDKFVYFIGDNWKLAIRTLEGEYPDYEAVIPDEDLQFIVNRNLLKQALKEVSSIFTKKKDNFIPVELIFTDEKIILKTSDIDASSETYVDVEEYLGSSELRGININRTFNGKYLIEFLRFSSESQRVVIGFDVIGDIPMVIKDTPIVMKPETEEENEEYLYLVMPMEL
jgi:DNA polymerase-3 subunit beta